MSEGSITSVVPEERWGELNHDDLTRYSRQLLLSEIGIEGQRKLKGAKVLVVGTGGLGAPLALYLAAAGVGTLGLVDFDNVDISNLHRQIIHGTRDVDRPKVASARDRIRALNPLVNVVTYNEPLKSENALDIISEYDVVADGTDNYPTRYQVNDACVLLGKPNVYGSVFQFEGQASVFYAKQGPCYRCLYREPPPPGLVPSCAEGGVLGVLPGVIGMLQANEVIKLLVGGGDTLTGRLLLYDAWRMKFRELKLEKDPECPICGKHPTITKLIDYEQFCGIRHNQDETSVESISATELKRRFDANEPVQVVDLREPHERAYFKFPNAKTIPLGQVIRRKDELDPSIDTVFVCKIGQSSILAVRNLRAAGYQGKLMNLLDGVQGWKNEVDPNVKLI